MSVTIPKVEKKVKAKNRHKRVAEAYEKWLSENPKAKRQRRLQTFDAISDSAFLDDYLTNAN